MGWPWWVERALGIAKSDPPSDGMRVRIPEGYDEWDPHTWGDEIQMLVATSSQPCFEMAMNEPTRGIAWVRSVVFDRGLPMVLRVALAENLCLSVDDAELWAFLDEAMRSDVVGARVRVVIMLRDHSAKHATALLVRALRDHGRSTSMWAITSPAAEATLALRQRSLNAEEQAAYDAALAHFAGVRTCEIDGEDAMIAGYVLAAHGVSWAYALVQGWAANGDSQAADVIRAIDRGSRYPLF